MIHNELYAGTFTLDFFTQELRREIKKYMIRSDERRIEQMPTNTYDPNVDPLCLLLGESNRLTARYSLITALLKKYQAKKKKQIAETIFKSDYFNYLYENYRARKGMQRIKGIVNCYKKSARVISIFEYLSSNGGKLEGLYTYLANKERKTSNHDYPIAILTDEKNLEAPYVQLDGSHRRSVLAYLGKSSVENAVITMGQLREISLEGSNIYLCRNLSKFERFLKDCDLYTFR